MESNEYRIPTFMGFIQEAAKEISQNSITPSIIMDFRLIMNFQTDSDSRLMYGKYNLINLTNKYGYKTPFDQSVDGWQPSDVVTDISDAIYRSLPTQQIEAAGMTDDVQIAIDEYLQGKVLDYGATLINTLEIRVVVNTTGNIVRVVNEKT